MTNSSLDISFDSQYNPSFKFTTLPAADSQTSLSPEILMKIHRRDGGDVSVSKHVYTESIKKALGTDRADVLPEIQKIHKVVTEVLTQTTDESEIAKLLKTVKNIEKFIRSVKETDQKALSERDTKLLAYLQDQVGEISKAIDSIEVPLEESPHSQELVALKDQLYEQLNKTWMHVIKLLPSDKISQSASEIGKASTATISAAIALQAQGTIISPLGTSTHDVFVRAAEKLAAKTAHKRALGDEQTIQQLSQILLPGSVLPLFQFSSLRPERQGYAMNPSLLAEGFSNKDEVIYSTTFKKRILENMKGASKDLAKELLKQEENFKSHQQLDYQYSKDGSWHPISFLELRELFAKDELKDMLVKKVGELVVPKSFKDYCEKNKDFHSALKFNLQENKRAFDLAKGEKLLEQFMSKKVLYNKDGFGWVEISFGDLKSLYLDKLHSDKSFDGFELKSSLNDAGKPFEQYCLENEDFFTALNFDPPKLDETPHFTFIPDLSLTFVKANYKECGDHLWKYKTIDSWKTVSFKELQKLWLEGKIKKNTEISMEGKPKWITKITPEDQQKLQNGLLEYQKSDGAWTILTEDVFKGIEKDTRITIREKPSTVLTISALKKPNVQEALNVQWKLITPELYSVKGDQIPTPLTNLVGKPFMQMSMLSELLPRYRDFMLKFLSPKSEAALLLTGRLQFLDLHHKNIGVTARITSDEFFDLLTKYPNFETDYEAIAKEQRDLQAYEFTYTDRNGLLQKNVSLKKLHEDFSAHKLNRFSVVSQNLPGEVLGPPKIILRNLALMHAVNEIIQKTINPIPTELVFFDTDLVLGESNLIESLPTVYSDVGTVVHHLIPLRSAYLGLGLSDKPLQSETIKSLLGGSIARFRELHRWVDNKDAPIRQFLPKNPNFLDDFLKLVLPLKGFSLSYWRSQPGVDYDDVTVPFVREKFVQRISKLSSEGKLLWKRIEDELKTYTLNTNDLRSADGTTPKTQDDIWSTISKRYKVPLKELKSLNPGLTSLKSGTQLKVPSPSPYSGKLDADTPESQKLREKIASELFPRITVPQKRALFEREGLLLGYLQGYAEFAKPLVKPEPLTIKSANSVEMHSIATLTNIEEFINIAPMTSQDKEKYKSEIDSLTHQIGDNDIDRDPGAAEKNVKIWETISLLHETIKASCIPTYANTMKVMYPLLADAQLLFEKFAPSKKDAGEAMGSWDSPLEMIIATAKGTDPAGIYHKTAIELEKKINAVAAPSRYIEARFYRKHKFVDVAEAFRKRFPNR